MTAAPTIQKGTRCGCVGCAKCLAIDESERTAADPACFMHAVRMVTMRVLKGGVMPSPSAMQETFVDVPMCAACASHHEAKARAER